MLFTIVTTGYAQKYGNTPKDSVDCIMNNSLYQEFYNQKNYKDAYEPWKHAVAACPKNHVNLYIRGAVILKNLFVQAKTVQEQDKYLDELMALYDKRTEAFGQEANNIARKAKDISDLRPNEKERAYNFYKEAAEKSGVNGIDLDDQYKPLYLKACFDYLHSIKANEEQMTPLFDAYDFAADALDASLKQAKESQDEKAEAKIKEYIAATEQIIEPFASCDKIVSIYQPKYDKESSNIDLLRKITTNLERKGCTKSDLFFKATESLHKLEPNSRSAFMMGQMLAVKGENRAAANYFKESLDKAEDNDSKAKACYFWAQTLMASDQYAAARSAFYQVSNYDKSKEGECLYFVASMYLSSAAACATHEGKIRGAAWAAYDKAARAKALDPSIADKCDALMRSAVGQWPTTDNAFFYEITNGQSYTVGCWIGETTTVRLR
jgi:tetratricopeptide (TPR) repeat protein